MGQVLQLVVVLLIIHCVAMILVSWVGTTEPIASGPLYIFDTFSPEEDIFHVYLMDMGRDIYINLAGSPCGSWSYNVTSMNRYPSVVHNREGIYVVTNLPEAELCKL